MKNEQRHKNNFNSINSGSSNFPLWEVDGMKIGDDVLTAGLIVGGGLVAYTLYKSFQGAQATLAYSETKIDDAQDYLTKQTDRALGLPEYLWTESIGQGGLGLTGNNAETYTDANRTLLGKDEGSWGWGYGPKKGWILG